MDYKRYFVTLRCDGKGYEYQNRRPLGQCIIERRGSSIKISVMVQDLKPETVYSPYVIFCKGEHNIGLPVGKLNVNERGKGELKRELDDAEGRNIPKIDDFCAVTVVVHKKDDFVSPLVGFKDEEVMWKNKLQFLDYMTDQKNTTKLPLTERTKEIAGAEDKPKEEAETAKEEPEEKPDEKDVEEEAQPVVETAMTEDHPDVEASAVEEISEQNLEDENAITEEEPDGMIEEEELLLREEPEEVPKAETIAAEALAENISATEPSAEIPEVNANTWEEALKEENLENAIKTMKEHGDPPANADDFYGNVNRETAVLHESFKTMAQKFRKEMEELENFQFYPDGKAEEEEKADNHAGVKASGHEPEPRDELEYIFRHNISMTPFKRQSRPVRWVRISLREPVSLPINYQLLMKSPFVILAYKKYNHLILGETKESSNQQYILGIPGVYEPEYKGAAFNLGFTQFKCCDDIKPSYGAYGYWLMFINRSRDHSASR